MTLSANRTSLCLHLISNRSSGTCMNRKEELMFFLLIGNSYTRNGDHLSLITITGSLHKKRICHKLPFILLKSLRGRA